MGRKLDGTPHAHPPEVAAAINAALDLTRDDLMIRVAVTSQTSADFIRDEVIVHLIRRTAKDNSEAWFARLWTAFRLRVVRRLPKGDDIASEEIRTQVVDKITELITQDRQEPCGRLDMFEMRFDLAMKRLIQDAKRRVLPRAKATTGFDPTSETDIPVEIVEAIRRFHDLNSDFFSDPDCRADLFRAIGTLPENERRVATMMMLGMPDVDNVIGGASITKEMGRSARMVQNYRTAAVEKLRRILVEGEKS